MLYQGQTHTVAVPLPGAGGAVPERAAIRAAFEAAYRAAFCPLYTSPSPRDS